MDRDSTALSLGLVPSFVPWLISRWAIFTSKRIISRFLYNTHFAVRIFGEIDQVYGTMEFKEKVVAVNSNQLVESHCDLSDNSSKQGLIDVQIDDFLSVDQPVLEDRLL